VLDVPIGFDQRDQLEIYPQLQHWSAGVVGASGRDVLFDLRGIKKVQKPLMSDNNPLALDVEKRTTRGRVCPRCGGKIIPSDRAVYQSGADPTGSFPLWTCERCGYEEVGERRKPAGKAKH
jgi:ribosomal protein S27AE